MASQATKFPATIELAIGIKVMVTTNVKTRMCDNHYHPRTSWVDWTVIFSSSVTSQLAGSQILAKQRDQWKYCVFFVLVLHIIGLDL